MCCFSTTTDVRETAIFARVNGPGTQVLAYRMRFKSLVLLRDLRDLRGVASPSPVGTFSHPQLTLVEAERCFRIEVLLGTRPSSSHAESEIHSDKTQFEPKSRLTAAWFGKATRTLRVCAQDARIERCRRVEHQSEAVRAAGRTPF
jgi:hypothetical protein